MCIYTYICKTEFCTNFNSLSLENIHIELQYQIFFKNLKQKLNNVRIIERLFFQRNKIIIRPIKVSLRFFPRGNLRLLLTSPMGTTSTLLFERPRDVLSSSFDDWPFLSVHFWGEKADGRWTLQVNNAGNRHVNSPGKYPRYLIFS